VLLMHVGAFNAVMLPPLFDLLRTRGFELVTLDDAESDPVYTADPDFAVPDGATLLDRMLAAKRVPRPAASGPPMQRLGELCK
jgi:hypothetical protein